ncbi:MAG: alpha/beta hydrolase [Bacteroidota bacterium]|nr:MAG: alpha/beta hydrolase [Bacteroidota bacterium]
MKPLLIIILVLLNYFGIQVFSQETNNNSRIGSNTEIGKYIAIDKSKIYYEIYGQGTPLLLLHGGLGSIENFKKCIPELASHFKVIALDSPGHGRSSQTDSLSYEFLSDKISIFIDSLQLDSLYVMGWSDGGVIGLILASDRPDKVKKLIAVGANSRLDGIDEMEIAWMKNEMIDGFKNNKDWLDAYLSLTPEPERVDTFLKNTQKMWLAEVYVPESKIKAILIPTMIVQGDRDGIRIEHTTELYRNIDQSQLCILPQTSHFVFDERPEWICTLAIDFFGLK